MEPTTSLKREMELDFGRTMKVGAYANQRLNLPGLGRPKEERQDGPGRTAIRNYTGVSGNVVMAGNVNLATKT